MRLIPQGLTLVLLYEGFGFIFWSWRTLLGLERASKSFKTIAFCEIDAFCTQILNKHWPDVPVYQDIRELTYEKLKADGVVADSVCDGFNTSEQGIVPPANDRPRQGKMLCKLADIPHRERDLEPLQDSHTI